MLKDTVIPRTGDRGKVEPKAHAKLGELVSVADQVAEGASRGDLDGLDRLALDGARDHVAATGLADHAFGDGLAELEPGLGAEHGGHDGRGDAGHAGDLLEGLDQQGVADLAALG